MYSICWTIACSIDFYFLHYIYFSFMYIFYLTNTGIVGEMGDSADSIYIWTHKKLDIGYNDQQVGW